MTGIVKTDQIQGAQGTTVTVPTGNTLAVTSNATVGGTLSVTGIGTFADDIVIGDGKTIGSASKTDAITIASSGLTQLRSTGIGAGSQVFQVIDDGATLFQLRAEDGNISFPQAGAGIYLGVTSGTAANLLNDYEEGTWTAVLTGSSSNPSSTVQTTGARYTKIGRLVFVQAGFSNVNTTGASGAPRVTGLPFSAGTSFATGNVMLHTRFAVGGGVVNVSPFVSTTQVQFYQSTSVGGWAEIAHSAGTGAYLYFTAVYDTNS